MMSKRYRDQCVHTHTDYTISLAREYSHKNVQNLQHTGGIIDRDLLAMAILCDS